MKKIEVLTEIKSVKILEREDGRYDVQFNHWELRPFIFDWEWFLFESVDPEVVRKFKEENPAPTSWDDNAEAEYILKFNQLPKNENPITVVYRKWIDWEIINLTSYIKELCK